MLSSMLGHDFGNGMFYLQTFSTGDPEDMLSCMIRGVAINFSTVSMLLEEQMSHCRGSTTLNSDSCLMINFPSAHLVNFQSSDPQHFNPLI